MSLLPHTAAFRELHPRPRELERLRRAALVPAHVTEILVRVGRLHSQPELESETKRLLDILEARHVPGNAAPTPSDLARTHGSSVDTEAIREWYRLLGEAK